MSETVENPMKEIIITLCVGLTLLAGITLILWPLTIFLSVFMLYSAQMESYAIDKIIRYIVGFYMAFYPVTIFIGMKLSLIAKQKTNLLMGLIGLFICYSFTIPLILAEMFYVDL